MSGPPGARNLRQPLRSAVERELRAREAGRDTAPSSVLSPQYQPDVGGDHRAMIEPSAARDAVTAWLRGTQAGKRLNALWWMQHLIEHVCEDREPVAFVLGRDVAQLDELRWAAEQLGYDVQLCGDPACRDPHHVTLVTRPITYGTAVEGKDNDPG